MNTSPQSAVYGTTLEELVANIENRMETLLERIEAWTVLENYRPEAQYLQDEHDTLRFILSSLYNIMGN